jgi:hypothetical protein
MAELSAKGHSRALAQTTLLVVARLRMLPCVVESPAPMLHAAGIGAALFVLIGSVRMRLRRTPIIDWVRAEYAYHWGAEPDWHVTPLTLAAAVAAAGSLWGLACAAVTSVLPLPRAASGALLGVGVVKAAEVRWRRDPDRRAETDFATPDQYAFFAALGAVTAVLLQRRLR